MERIKPYLLHPDKIDAEGIKVIKSLMAQYPYCATLQILYVIALGNIHSTDLKDALKCAAVQIPNRTKLFTVTNHGKEEWGTILELLEREASIETQDDSFSLIDRYLEQQHLPQGMASLPIYDATQALQKLDDIEEEEYPTAPLETDLLDVENTLPSEEAQDNQDFLIDNFIEAEKNGTLFVPESPQEAVENESDNLDSNHIKIKDKAFLTESLAKVYIKQHKYEQALSIIRDLSVRYPEKNVYLCDQIRFLEKVISYKNNKNN